MGVILPQNYGGKLSKSSLDPLRPSAFWPTTRWAENVPMKHLRGRNKSLDIDTLTADLKNGLWNSVVQAKQVSYATVIKHSWLFQ
jgi:hypothetical protein